MKKFARVKSMGMSKGFLVTTILFLSGPLFAGMVTNVKLNAGYRLPTRLVIICIGINETAKDSGFGPLAYSVRDAQAVCATLEKVAKAQKQYKAVRVIRLLNKEATAKAILSTIAKTVPAEEQLNTELIVHFSGHAAAIGKTAYMVPSDGNHKKPETLIADTELAQAFAKANPHSVVLLFDTHHGAKFFHEVYMQYGGFIRAIGAAQVNGMALEDSKLEHGLLTYSLLKHLEKYADEKTAGKFHWLEIFRSVTTEVSSITAVDSMRQVPGILVADPRQLEGSR